MAVSQIFSAVEDGKIKAMVSIGCVYTLAYLIRMELKRQGIHRPEQTLRLRTTLNVVMSMVKAVGLSHKRLLEGINDVAFDDVEDSFQFQCALQNKCDALVTINLRDYCKADTSKMLIFHRRNSWRNTCKNVDWSLCSCASPMIGDKTLKNRRPHKEPADISFYYALRKWIICQEHL